MPIILSIETSTKACSAAIHQDGKLLSVSELYNEKSSSGMLTTLIEHVVKTASLKLQEVDAIAVAKGPGSYTGLRIGVSTAKGLCFTLEKPLIAINTLEAMAFSIFDLKSDAQNPVTNLQSSIVNLLCPMLDARRMEVYCAVYKADSLEVIEPTQAKIIDETSFADLLEKHQIIFFGDGAEKCRTTLGANPNAVFLNHTIYPSAKSIGALANGAFEQQQFENVADFEPFYLKEFVGTTPKKNSI
ncbi:tRNA (adenosine(37)-N6)-threonylcarbamoyltransferase complex dimerization subunit type 1 TsaB [Emticicia aquatilis]|uniref:tRNA (Adenosine(37)-N6)-threonylcarbamoyltransferase complex dimerization subunit type 1 TsaB n=1 Tax=Emticicia aquatilis TaxID=1537369 RepID=A0A917DIF5_9BACT|nr:tRNA (adenosine(37)-N6)-threonylcarbamoyltransferase complex dimerization subunit type 1 TsaB [Emticicia aquatilis]GGD41126.1 tRNA (adenosine(37)-N6)-threonylcarbamoyltransferase complex dimerization subunit type 1 TsaB [Emticicia aquatilis]